MLAFAGIAFRSSRRARRREKEFAAISAAALTDALTGILNRRGFTEAAERELARASRYNRPFALAYVDVRGLKTVNDTEGHLMGDELIRTVADLMKESARADDVVGRIGGDEFALLLGEQTAESAEPVVRRIRARVAEARAAMEISVPWELTMGWPHSRTTAPCSRSFLIGRPQALRAARYCLEVMGWGSRDLGVGRVRAPHADGEGPRTAIRFGGRDDAQPRASAVLSRSIDRPASDRLPEDREIERHQVAEQDQRDQALSAGLADALDAVGPGRLGCDQAAGELDPLADARMQVGVVEEHGAEAAELGGSLPSDDLVVVELGELVGEAGVFAFSLIWVFQRYAIGEVSPAPAICGIVPCSPRASCLASESSGASGPHSATICSTCAAATSISACSRSPAPHSPATSSATTSE